MSKLPHATTDNRYKKAINIENLLSIKSTSKTYKILEIGTGSGLIASYFANQSLFKFEVHSVDVIDQCVDKNHINFQLIKNTILPYKNSEFDIVISNHVIEHVGDIDMQCSHLNEIYRVLKSDGEVYLACPNRFMIKEPHYQLYFLSWLPRALSNKYLTLFNKNNQYDCYPPHLIQLNNMLVNEKFKIQHVEDKIVNSLLNKNNNLVIQIAIQILCRLFQFWIPTFACILKK